MVDGVGACLAVACVMDLNSVGLKQFSVAVPLMAPLGASAVIMFCARQMPSGRAWNVVVGNVVSALVGVACAIHLHGTDYAAPAAIFLAIAAMVLTRALHPPGGAIALTAVIGGRTVRDAGYYFALNPVLISSLILVGVSAGFHYLRDRFFPRRWP